MTDMMRHRSSPNVKTLVAMALLMSATAAMGAAAPVAQPISGREQVAEFLAHVNAAVRSMRVVPVVERTLALPGLATALHAQPKLSERSCIFHLPQPFHPQLMNLPPPTRVL